MIYFGSNKKLVKVGALLGYLVYVLALTGKKKKMIWKSTYEEEGLILAHGYKGFNSWLARSIALGFCWGNQYIMVGTYGGIILLTSWQQKPER